MPNVHNLEALKEWLDTNGIDISQWGSGGAKTVANLWEELANGDIRLLDNPPTRIVHVVEVCIQKGNLVLKELKQEFGDGQLRTRNRLPSEKMKPDEDCNDAALRCLREELGVDKKDVTFVTSACTQRTMQVESPSYPGLDTQYTFHTITATVNQLPEADFWQDNAANNQGDPIKRHHWGWREE